jgi:hypothetical protein
LNFFWRTFFRGERAKNYNLLRFWWFSLALG